MGLSVEFKHIHRASQGHEWVAKIVHHCAGKVVAHLLQLLALREVGDDGDDPLRLCASHARRGGDEHINQGAVFA